MDEITVTVVCMAYNHADYIRDALEGFVAQRTGFPFEVIVHDDASTDGTADIIREYAGRFPDIIRPVFQKENQYSKGIPVTRDSIFPMIRGRYVALCEGDDWWTDPSKLRKQVEALDNHPDADICTHRATRRRKGRFDGWVAPAWRDCVIPVEKVILGGGAHFCATSSYLCRREAYLEWTPMREVRMNDYALAIQASLRGGMVYLNEPMSVYRKGVKGSWTSLNRGNKKIANKEVIIRMLSALDGYTDGKYHDIIVLRQKMFRSDILMIRRDYPRLFSPKRLGINLFRMRSAIGRTIRKWTPILIKRKS